MAETYELGAAYLSLLVSTKGMKPSVRAAMQELDAETGKAVQKSGNKLVAGVGGAIGKVAKVGALGIAGLGAAVVGLAAKGGISRALNIEDAQAKLKGLGHDTKTIDQIMGDALKSVKGTAFGLGDAATVAAAAVAGGVKPGKDLERTLKLVGDAATIGGASMGEMGSIFNKAAASNKVQGDILAQLGDRGIPIVALLGKEMGKTAEEVYKMSEAGKIDFATFQNAIESGMGGAALSSGKTFRGAWANVMAALGRGGETVIKPVLDLLRDGFNKAIPIIDNVTNALKPFMAALSAKAPAVIQEITGGFKAFSEAFRDANGDVTSSGFPGFMERLANAMVIVWDVIQNRIIPAMQVLGDWVVRNKDWLGALTVAVATGAVFWKLYNLALGGYAAIGSIVTGVTTGMAAAQTALNKAWKAHPIGMIITAVAALVAGFIYLWNTNEGFRNFFIGAWNLIKTVVGTVGGFIGGVFSAIGGWITNTLGPAFVWLWSGVIQPVWTAIQGAIATAWGFIQTVFTAIGGFISGVLGPVFTWLYETIIKPVWAGISFAIDAAYNVMLLIFDLIVWTLKNVVGPMFKWLYESVIKPVWAGIQTAISVAWEFIKLIFTAAVGMVKNSLGAVFTWLYEYVIKPVWAGIKWYIGLVWEGLKIIFTAIKNFVRDVLGPIFKWVYEKVIKPVWDGIKSTISSVWEKGIKPIFTALGNFITDTVAPAFKKGVDIIKGFWENLKEIALAPVNFIIGTVYNKGIVGTFNNVAKAIGSKANLKEIPEIRFRAKGGYTPRGWTMVGEKGPELVNFASPGMVYTAAQTKLMQEGQAQMPMGALESKANPMQAEKGIGGFWSDTVSNVGGAVAGAWKKATDWVRGGLAKTAELILSPIRSGMNAVLPGDGFGGIVKGAGNNVIDSVIKWIRGKDEEATAEGGGGGGSFGGSYDGALGRFFRPGGRITSGFGTSRGKYPHAGIDFAVPIGTAVKAMFDGVVQRAAWNAVGGRSGMGMLLGHGGGMNSYYGHLSQWLAKPGQRVKAGETIAKSGNTGRSTGPHLHAELWKGGSPFNFMSYLHDSGGWHAPGTMSYNGLKQPEAILTPSQWDSAERAIALATGTEANGDHFTLQLPKSAEVEDFIAAIRFEKRRRNRGGKL